MKNLFLTFLTWMTLSFCSAFASGFIKCELDATVENVQMLAILDGEASLERSDDGENTYQYIAKLKINSAVLLYGHGTCSSEDVLIALKSGTQVSVGQLLKLEFMHSSDRAGERTKFTIK